MSGTHIAAAAINTNSNPRILKALDQTASFFIFNIRNLCRKPRPLPPTFNVVWTFTWLVWLFIFISLAVLSGSFYGFYTFYCKTGQSSKLKKQPTTKWDFIIIPFTNFTEPDPIHWFGDNTKGGSLRLFHSNTFEVRQKPHPARLA